MYLDNWSLYSQVFKVLAYFFKKFITFHIKQYKKNGKYQEK